MSRTVEILEQRVLAAAELIDNLRLRVRSLERELNSAHARPLPPPPAPDSSLVEELERLRAERVVVRENIRELLKEIDRVSW